MVVLVTGSSKGIGYQIASDLLDQGHDLVLHCNRNKSSVEDLLSAYKSNSVIIQADLSSYNDIKKFIKIKNKSNVKYKSVYWHAIH